MILLEKYRKVIVTNHVIEIYEYEKMPGVPDMEKNDDYNPLDLELTKHDREEDRTDDIAGYTCHSVKHLGQRNEHKAGTGFEKSVELFGI